MMRGMRVVDAAIFATPPFHRLVPITERHQTAPVLEAFNWTDVLAEIPSGHWYLVVFRSLRRHDADDGLLVDHDDLAFAEAMRLGGLLRYYKGVMDPERHCVSLCVWERRAQARVATALPDHRAAAELTHRFYVWYDVERHILRKRRGSRQPELVGLPGYRHRPSVDWDARQN